MPHHLDYLSSIKRDGSELGDAAEVAGPSIPIVGCPGWTVADLVWHITGVHHFWGTIAGERLHDPDQVPEIIRPAGFDELLSGYRQGVHRLVDSLAGVEPATPVWTWASQKDVAFIIRHQAQEAAVHRWDAEEAGRRGFSIDSEIAADAIDEFLDCSAIFRREGAASVGGTVHLHCTDIKGEWLAWEEDGGRLLFERGHGKGDAAARGTASDLLLLLYRRIGPEAVEVAGDDAVLERFLARTDLS